MAGTILTTTEDYDMVRTLLAVDALTLPDSAISADNILGVVEVKLTKMLASKAVCGVPSVAQIVAGTSPATASDLILLRAAASAWAAYILSVAIPGLQTTSVTDGSQTVDYGGAGTSYRDLGDAAFAQVGAYLSDITNWCEGDTDIFRLGGPTSEGVLPDSLSGFRLR